MVYGLFPLLQCMMFTITLLVDVKHLDNWIHGIRVRKVIQNITKSISCNSASVLMIITFIHGLRLTLEKNGNSNRGVCTMKADMLQSLNERRGKGYCPSTVDYSDV